MKKEELYTPPFTVSAEAINLVAEISAQVERFAIRLEQADGLLLRKANRIKTIHSSLAIEGNTLSEEEVKDVINGKQVVAPLREIQEVKNAIKTYELYPTLDAFKETDLLKAHGIMMQALVENAGHYRSGSVGVFGNQGLVHLAPPAARVPLLMADLFRWLQHAQDHLLIRSCVFHYEFEFIHPFVDGNGRMGRLWQSLILGKLNPVFEHLPIENMVYSNQQKYYEAISKSTKAAESGPFIDFMLEEILKTLKEHQGELKTTQKTTEKTTQKILKIMKSNSSVTIDYLCEACGLTRDGINWNIRKLKEQGKIRRIGPDKGGHWEVIEK